MSVLSTAPVWAEGITSDLPNGPTDPRQYLVEMAFALPDVEPATWATATWDGSSPATGPFRAAVLVGPNGVITPGLGRWRIWVRITVGSVLTVLPAGWLTVEEP